MKLITRLTIFCYALLVAQIGFSQIPSIADFDRLLDFGESTFPSLLTPPTPTTATAAEGSTWFYRDYGFLAVIPGGSGLVVAVNVTGGGGFVVGDVYAVGGDYGSVPVLVDTLTNLLTLVPGTPGSGGESGITNAGNGNCVNINNPAQGSSATFQSVTTTEDGPFTLDYSRVWNVVSDTLITTETTQSLVTGPLVSNSTTITTQMMEIINDLRYLKEIDIDLTASGSAGGIPLPETTNNTNTTFEPSLFEGPATQLCEGQEWFVASVLETITMTPDLLLQGPISTNSSESNVTVNSINTQVTVQAGTFSTVQITIASDDGTVVNNTDPATGLTIKTQFFEPGSEQAISTTELVQVN